MNVTWIEPGMLAASSMPVDAEDIHKLHQTGFQAILTLTEMPLTRMIDITPRLLKELDMAYFHVPIEEYTPPTLTDAHQILKIMSDMTTQQRPLLVHCEHGIGRTGTALYLYYLAHGLSVAQAGEKIGALRKRSTELHASQLAFLHKVARETAAWPA